MVQSMQLQHGEFMGGKLNPGMHPTDQSLNSSPTCDSFTKKESPAQLIHCEHGHGEAISAFMMVLSHIAGEQCDPSIWLPLLQHGSGVATSWEQAKYMDHVILFLIGMV